MRRKSRVLSLVLSLRINTSVAAINYVTVDFEMQVTTSATDHKSTRSILALHIVMRQRYSPDNHRGARGRCASFAWSLWPRIYVALGTRGLIPCFPMQNKP